MPCCRRNGPSTARASGSSRASPKNGLSNLRLLIALRQPGTLWHATYAEGAGLGPGVLQRFERPLEIVDVLAQRPDHCWIEVVARHRLHDLEGLLERVCRLVVARRGQRIEDVGDRDDARPQHDALGG